MNDIIKRLKLRETHTCDICGKNRGHYTHIKCSKIRQKLNAKENTQKQNPY